MSFGCLHHDFLSHSLKSRKSNDYVTFAQPNFRFKLIKARWSKNLPTTDTFHDNCSHKNGEAEEIDTEDGVVVIRGDGK